MAKSLLTPRGSQVVGGVLLLLGCYLVWSFKYYGALLGIAGAVLIARSFAKRRVLLFIASCAPVLALSARLYFLDRNFQNEYAADQVLTLALEPVCDKQQGSVASAAYDKKAPGPHRLLGFYQLSNSNSWFRGTPGPKAWKATTLAEAQLVVCARTTTSTLETCHYEAKDGKGGTEVARVRYGLNLELREARNGNLVSSGSVDGSEPGPCPDVKTFGRGRDKDVFGSLPNLGDGAVSEFVRPFAE